MPHLADGDINADYSVLPTGSGDAAVDKTVEHMVEMASGKWGRESPKVRAAAINIINGVDPLTGNQIGTSTGNKDYFGYAEAIHNYVRDNIRYIKDVVGQETLSYPEETLFNSRAGDCDDMVILEIALLGSIGIRAYPVVIGLFPNHYSHVYLQLEIPPGKHRYAGMTIAADPIMREWPLGKAAPDDRVKAKKVYSDLSGWNAMPLNGNPSMPRTLTKLVPSMSASARVRGRRPANLQHQMAGLSGYASAPAYLAPADELEASQVPAVMASRYVDTGGSGQIMNRGRLTAWGDELDEMFDRNATINPMQAAPASMMYSRGPIQAKQERDLTSYLEQGPINRGGTRRGPVVVTVQDKKLTTMKRPTAPTVGELMGLADYLGELKAHATRASVRQTVHGRSDVVHKAAAAAAHAGQRAKKASAKVVRMANQGFMPGFGAMDPATASNQLQAALAVEKLAHQLAAQARAIAKQAAGTSPVRQAALGDDITALSYMDRYIGLTDMVNDVDLPQCVPARDNARIRTNSLHTMMFDPQARDAANLAATPPKPKKRAPTIRTELPSGAVVRDQNGNVIQHEGDDTDEGGEGLAGFFSKVSQAVSNVASTVKSTVKSPGKLAAAVATGGLTTQLSATKAAVATLSPKVANALDVATKAAFTGGLSLTAKGIQKLPQNIAHIIPQKAPAQPQQPVPYVDPGQDTYVPPNDTYVPPVDPNAGYTDPYAGATSDPYAGATSGAQDYYDPSQSGESLVPQPGESMYDGSMGPPTDDFGPEDMTAEESYDDTTGAMGPYGGGQSNTTTMMVDDGGYDGGSGDGGAYSDGSYADDDATEGSADDTFASNDDSATDSSDDDTEGADYAPPPTRKKAKRRPAKRRSRADSSDVDDGSEASNDDSDIDSSDDVATEDVYRGDDDGAEDGGAGDSRHSALSPSVSGFGDFSIGTALVPLAATAAILYFLGRRKRA